MPAWRVLLPAALFLVRAAAAYAVTIAGHASAAPRFAVRDLLADRLWDDGQAEFSVYEGTITRYGASRALAARIIVVKEDMDLAQRVKSDAGPVAGKTRTVIKQNYLHDFTTGSYDYHQMTSTFLDRGTGRLEKLAMSSTEGCGITFVELLPQARGWRHVSHSYWDGEADRDRMLVPGAGRTIVAADALPLWLRRLDLSRAQSFEVDLLPSQLAGRVRAAAFVPATIEAVGRPDRHGLPVRVRFTGAGGKVRTDRYWFDRSWPHTLVRFEGGDDPTVLERVKTMRLAYWQKNAPGDERLLAP
jgi:hypothetical protein